MEQLVHGIGFVILGIIFGFIVGYIVDIYKGGPS